MKTRLIKLLTSIVIYIFDRLRILTLRILRKQHLSTCVVLNYHTVTIKQRNKFAQQMRALIKLVKPIAVNNKESLIPGYHYAAITFDDGIASIIKNAIPVLLQYNIPFTIFFPTSFLGRYPKWIKNNGFYSTNEIIITTDQLKKLKENNLITIGSHCVTHSNLLLLNESEARNEIFKSKRDLEDILKTEIKLLSFPYGSYDEKHLELAHEAGYERVFTILPKLAFSNPKEYVTGRITVDPTDWPIEFRLKLLGAYRWLPIAFFLKHKLRSIKWKHNE